MRASESNKKQKPKGCSCLIYSVIMYLCTNSRRDFIHIYFPYLPKLFLHLCISSQSQYFQRWQYVFNCSKGPRGRCQSRESSGLNTGWPATRTSPGRSVTPPSHYRSPGTTLSSSLTPSGTWRLREWKTQFQQSFLRHQSLSLNTQNSSMPKEIKRK